MASSPLSSGTIHGAEQPLIFFGGLPAHRAAESLKPVAIFPNLRHCALQSLQVIVLSVFACCIMYTEYSKRLLFVKGIMRKWWGNAIIFPLREWGSLP